MAEKTTKIQIRLSPRDLRLLRRVSRAEDMNMTEWITTKIHYTAELLGYLKKQKEIISES